MSKYDGNLESVDLRESATSIDNSRVVIRTMTGAADETQELVQEDECPERPARMSTPVPGHHEEISGPFLNTTDILTYISVSGYHSLSVSEMEGAEPDQRQTPTTSPGLLGYTASVSTSCQTNQSSSPQTDSANQMPGSFGGGDSGPWDSVIHHDHDKLDDHCEQIPVPLIHEVIIPRPVTSMADFVFTSISRAAEHLTVSLIITSFTSANVKLRLRFYLHLTFN